MFYLTNSVQVAYIQFIVLRLLKIGNHRKCRVFIELFQDCGWLNKLHLLYTLGFEFNRRFLLMLKELLVFKIVYKQGCKFKKKHFFFTTISRLIVDVLQLYRATVTSRPAVTDDVHPRRRGNRSHRNRNRGKIVS